MTFIGKLLVFLNLILGVGVAIWSTSIYAQRPGWFNPPPEGGVDKGHSPMSFPQMTAEITSLGKAAVSASNSLSAQLKALDYAERVRDYRYAKMFGTTRDGKRAKNADGTDATGLLDYARQGDPRASGNAFFVFAEDPATKLYDLEKRGGPIPGPDNKPLRGSETLMGKIVEDQEAVTGKLQNGVLQGGAAQDIDRLRAEQKQLQGDVRLVETQLIKQRDILENLRNEASYLSTLEVNVAEQRDTASRRRDQLKRRIAVFAPGN